MPQLASETREKFEDSTTCFKHSTYIGPCVSNGNTKYKIYLVVIVPLRINFLVLETGLCKIQFLFITQAVNEYSVYWHLILHNKQETLKG